MRTAIAVLSISLAVALGCARHVVVEREAAIEGLGDGSWTIQSEPAESSGGSEEGPI
jgi:hypothetical protein